MAVSIATRPRTQAERQALAQVLFSSPATIGIAHADDGWAAAALSLSGRKVCWQSTASSRPATNLLASLSLPELSFEPAAVQLDDKLQPQGRRPAGLSKLPNVDGPLTSVVLCTYNRLPLLKQAVESVRAQSWPVEMIVVDDGSTDGTHRWLKSQKDLRVFSHEHNLGKIAALATGLKQVQGTYTLVFDDDDLLLPGAVQALATTLEACPALTGIFGDSILFSDTEIHSYRPALRVPPHVMRRASLAQIPGLNGAFLVRSSIWEEVGAFDPRLSRGEDIDMFQRIARLGDIEALPLPTLYCRLHDGKKQGGSSPSKAASRIQPVFLERWRSHRAEASRAEGFSWALGLHNRGLTPEAHIELARWSTPDTPSEAWTRSHVGAQSTPETTQGNLVVVDDGDPGALEACLERHNRRDLRLWVNLEVPREPIGQVRLHWDGEYAAQERLEQWLDTDAPVHLRLSSSPEWCPPPIEDLSMLPPLPAADALLVLGAAMDWPAPSLLRRGIGPMGQLSWQAWRARRKLKSQEPRKALAALGPLLEALPEWAPGWRMAAEAFEGLGLREDANRCRTRELLHLVA